MFCVVVPFLHRFSESAGCVVVLVQPLFEAVFLSVFGVFAFVVSSLLLKFNIEGSGCVCMCIEHCSYTVLESIVQFVRNV